MTDEIRTNLYCWLYRRYGRTILSFVCHQLGVSHFELELRVWQHNCLVVCHYITQFATGVCGHLISDRPVCHNGHFLWCVVLWNRPCAAVTSDVNGTRTLETETKGPRPRPGYLRPVSGLDSQHVMWCSPLAWCSSARLLPSLYISCQQAHLITASDIVLHASSSSAVSGRLCV